MKHFPFAALAYVLLPACTPSGVSNSAESPSNVANNSNVAERRRAAYIAFAPPSGQAAMLATFGGRFEIINDCLVVRSPTSIHVPVFAPSADTFVTERRVVIAGRAVPLGTEVEIGGGQMGINDDSVLERPRPSNCRHRLLRVATWAPVRR